MIFQYNNIPIFYELYGQGPAVVLLHGFLESATIWQPILPQLTEKNTVITLDFPGHGKSGIIAETHSMELMAEVVHKVLKELKVSSATFIGHSMGGYVALAYAEAYGEEIEKLVLLNSNPAADSAERKENRDRSLTIIDKIPHAYISMAIGNLPAEASRERFTEEIETLKMEAYTFPSEGIKAAIRGMRDRKDRTQVLADFNKEKYMILGKEDPLLPIDENEQLAQRCGTPLKIIDGGHLSLIENLPALKDYLHLIL